MSYEIIIKQTGYETKMLGGNWEKIDETFFSQDDIKKLDWMDQEKKKSAEVKDLKKTVMGYTPKIEKSVPFDKEIFRQTVEELDLTLVVKAVNKLP